ncbi:MAG: hypothetical protein ACRD3W_18355 [Terriglobales bacterium]
MHHVQNEQYCVAEVEEIFCGLAFGIDAEAWISGRNTFFEHAEVFRARTRFALAHYLFFGDPTRGLPALGYGSDKEREWVIKQILAERHKLINDPEEIYARTWRKRAGECVPITLETVSIQQLKASIVACSAYAAIPPSADDAQRLTKLIEQLRKELSRRITGPTRKTH